jgi:anthranilate phosphoribosyltransferase
VEVVDGRTEEWFVHPEELGLDRAPLESLAGGSPEENAAVTRRVLAGEHGPARDVALLNAGAAIYTGGGSSDLAQGIASAEAAIDSGSASELLERLIEISSSFPAAR